MRLIRIAGIALGAFLALAVAVAIAATDLDNTDRAIVGTASTDTNPAELQCGGPAVTIHLQIIADNGNIPDNVQYPESGTVTTPTALSVNSAGALVASGQQSDTFTAAQNFNTTSETLTFEIDISAAADAPAGPGSGVITFSESGAGMVNLGSQVDLNIAFTAPLVYWNVTCAAGYEFDGFYQPVNGNSTDDPDFYITAKAGQSIALKWNLYDSDGNVITDVSKYTASSMKITCALTGDGDDEPVAEDSGNSGFRYDEDGEQSIYVWKTLKNWANTCRTFELFYDGTLVAELTVHFTK
jgi:hypothetical protein